MKKIESDCVDCGFPCMGTACPHYQIEVYICDECGSDCEKLYYFDGKELCIDCIESQLEEVE